MSPQPPDSSLPEDQHAWGFGLATVADDGTVLDTWFPAPELGEAPGGNAPESSRRWPASTPNDACTPTW